MVGFVVVLLVVIRAFGAFSLPLAAFVVAMGALRGVEPHVPSLTAARGRQA